MSHGVQELEALKVKTPRICAYRPGITRLHQFRVVALRIFPLAQKPVWSHFDLAGERWGEKWKWDKGRGDWHICRGNGTEAGRESVDVIREAALIPGCGSEQHSPLIPSLYSQICLCLSLPLLPFICLSASYPLPTKSDKPEPLIHAASFY